MTMYFVYYKHVLVLPAFSIISKAAGKRKHVDKKQNCHSSMYTHFCSELFMCFYGLSDDQHRPSLNPLKSTYVCFAHD